MFKKEQARVSLSGFFFSRYCKEEAMTGNCTPFAPAMECLIAQDDGVSLFCKQCIFKDKWQQASRNRGPK
jgi:hypothetical protein